MHGHIWHAPRSHAFYPCPLCNACLPQVTVVDQLVMRKFGRSWVENAKAAGIGYWAVAALDPWTSQLLGHWGLKQCFNAPMEKMRNHMRGSGGKSDVCGMVYSG